MTTVADLIDMLSKFPPDTAVVTYHADTGLLATVTGTLFDPAGKYLTEVPDSDEGVMVEGPTVELCND